MPRVLWAVIVLIAVALGDAAAVRADGPATTRPASSVPQEGAARQGGQTLQGAAEARHAPLPYVLHLPGVGGYLAIDRDLLEGLAAGGVRGTIEHYDWTNHDPGLRALRDQANHAEQVKRVAEKLDRQLAAHPDQPVTLIGHSGGCAIAVWALQRLPADRRIDRLILIAPALSPAYDLTDALRHVRERVWVFSSPHDPVLGPGTRLLGTMDGVHTDAAGRVGFSRPPGADEQEYEKIVPMPYRSEWVELDNPGDHIGPMSWRFAREMIAPLIAGHAPSGDRLK